MTIQRSTSRQKMIKPTRNNEIETISKTIIWIAEERIKSGEKYQNINSAIHAVLLEVQNELMETMKYQK